MSDPGNRADLTGRKADIVARMSAVGVTADSQQVLSDFRI